MNLKILIELNVKMKMNNIIFPKNGIFFLKIFL